MRKYLIGFCSSLVVSFFIILCVGTVAFASSVPNYIRVGLEYKYKGVDSVPISNNDITFGFDSNSGFSQEAVISSSSGFSMNISNLYYLQVDEFFNSYDAAKIKANSLTSGSASVVPACIDSSRWTVYIGGFAGISAANSAKTGLAVNSTVVQPNSRIVELKANGASIAVFDNPFCFPQVFAGDRGILTLGDRKYRGRVEFVRTSSGKLTAVNVLTLDEYLYGVTPSEMPSYWNAEALKAQAVASRTYAVNRFGLHSDYDLCDGVHCQAYKGYDNEAASTNKAVEDTSDILIYYNGKPILAVFSSSSGGTTEDSENVWITAEPYLRGVSDSLEYEAKKWTRIFTLADLDTALSKNNVNIGKAVDVKIAALTNSGRVEELQIVGTAGVKSLKKEEVRTFFGVLGSSLDSRMFQIFKGNGSTNNYISVVGSVSSSQKTINGLYATDAYGNMLQLNNNVYVYGQSNTKVYQAQTQISAGSNDFVFEGRGFGHGVGMSQYGAKAMAEAGYNFVQILKHYYTGVDIL